MTGREFFSRFPSLHSFLIQQLEISLKDNERLVHYNVNKYEKYHFSLGNNSPAFGGKLTEQNKS